MAQSFLQFKPFDSRPECVYFFQLTEFILKKINPAQTLSAAQGLLYGDRKAHGIRTPLPAFARN
jgi:hypothetical protein